jgi:hypothetical protein
MSPTHRIRSAQAATTVGEVVVAAHSMATDGERRASWCAQGWVTGERGGGNKAVERLSRGPWFLLNSPLDFQTTNL